MLVPDFEIAQVVEQLDPGIIRGVATFGVHFTGGRLKFPKNQDPTGLVPVLSWGNPGNPSVHHD